MISRHGFGEDSPKSVERMWVWKGQRDMGLDLVQMERPFDIGGGEPAEINGTPGQRAFHPADGQRPASLTIGWDQFGASFALSAVLVDSVDEQEILKVAASLEHIQ